MPLINGNSGDDYLVGTAGDDVINGLEGDDAVLGLAGSDDLNGGAGNDVLTGGAGNDQIDGGDGDDVIQGDLISASLSGDGDDHLNGGSGRDLIYAGGGNDTVTGGADFDQIYGGDGADQIDGGDGDDFLIAGEIGTDAAADTVFGGTGNDRITAGYGDTVDGGADSDSLDLFLNYGASAGVTADFRELTNGGSLTIAGGVLTGIEYVTGLSLTEFNDRVIAGAVAGLQGIFLDGWGGDDDLTGTSGIDMISGGDGNDIIRGGVGFNPAIFPSTDRLRGDAGYDIIFIGSDGAKASGGDDDDTIYGGDAIDSIQGDDGNDILYGGGGNDGLHGGDGDDFLDGGTGADILSGSYGDDTYIIDNAGDVIYDNEGNNTVRSSISFILPEGTNTLILTGSADISGTGNLLANVINGNVGANILDGRAGADTMRGGAGDDLYRVDDGGDQVVENADEGVDTVRSSVSYALSANVENLGLTGDAAITGTGNGVANLLTGNGSANALSGLGGNDSLDGGGGDDTLDGGSGDDTLDGGFGRDTASYAAASGPVSVSLTIVGPQATGSAGNDTLIGIENLTGSAYGDTLTGNSSDNVIEGLGGNDILDGGDGTDTVSYASANAGVSVNLGLAGIQNTVGAGSDSLIGFEILYGSAHGDVLTSSSASGEVHGLAGDDRIISIGLGSHALHGDNGNDVFLPGLGDDWIYGGDGFDTVDYSSASGPVFAGTDTANNDTGSGYDTLIAVEKIIGSSYDDRLQAFLDGHQVWGGAGNDTLIGGFGAGQLHGGVGDDTYRISDTSNLIFEAVGEGKDHVWSLVSYTLPDNVENLSLLPDAANFDPYAGASLPSPNPVNGTGNLLDNVLTGNVYASRLTGLAGSDTLTGLGGSDTLTGGAGNDLFRDTAAGLNGDTITDFSARDRILITDKNLADFTFSLSGDTLTFTGGSLTLSGLSGGSLVARAAAEGGIALTRVEADARFANPGAVLVSNFAVGAGGWSSQDLYPRHVADMNGDGFGDIVGFGHAGTFVSYGSAGTSFSAPALVVSNFGQASGWTNDNQFHRELADLNGDGLADIIGFGIAGTWVSLAQANGTFSAPTLAVTNFGANQGWASQEGFARAVGDVNGDGKADIVGFGYAGTWLSLGRGDGTFGDPTLTVQNFGVQQGWASDSQFHRAVADINGDGFDDIVGFGYAGTWAALSQGDGTFGPAYFATDNFGRAQGWISQNAFSRHVADVNGDGIEDIVGFGVAGTWLAYGRGDGTFSAVSHDVDAFAANQGWTSDGIYHREIADLDGDGLNDIVGFGYAGVFAGINQGDWLRT